MDTLIEPLEELAGRAPAVDGAGVRVEQRHRAFPDLLVVTYVRTSADARELEQLADATGWHCTIPRGR